MRFAPRTFKSLPMSSSFSAERATRKNSTPSLAKSLAVSWAIAEAAPTIMILMLHRHHFFRITHAPPEARGEVGINIAGEFLPPGEIYLEVLGAHASIFSRVDCSSTFTHKLVQLIKQLQRLWAVVGEVQCKRDARPGE